MYAVALVQIDEEKAEERDLDFNFKRDKNWKVMVGHEDAAGTCKKIVWQYQFLTWAMWEKLVGRELAYGKSSFCMWLLIIFASSTTTKLIFVWLYICILNCLVLHFLNLKMHSQKSFKLVLWICLSFASLQNHIGLSSLPRSFAEFYAFLISFIFPHCRFVQGRKVQWH